MTLRAVLDLTLNDVILVVHAVNMCNNMTHIIPMIFYTIQEQKLAHSHPIYFADISNCLNPE